VIEQLVEQIETRFAEVSRQISDPDVIADRNRYAEAGRAFAELEPAAKLSEERRRAVDDAAGARELLDEDGDDPELRELLNSTGAHRAPGGGDPSAGGAGLGGHRPPSHHRRARRAHPGVRVRSLVQGPLRHRPQPA
jgi:hypothetical protein